MLPPLVRNNFTDAGDPRSVAVLVPSYSHSKYVERTLRSIFSQTLKPVDLLVIDDGSKDDSPEIIERVLRDAPFPAALIARENRGLSATLNQGFAKLCAGPSRFFAYIGSDDAWLPNFLEKRIGLLETRPNAALAYGNACSIDAEDRVIDCTVDWAHYADGDAREMLLDTIAPLSPTVVYRTAAIRDMSWNENSRLEDYEFYLRLSAKAEFAFDPAILSAWRQHGANASDGTQMMLEERLAALEVSAGLFGLSPSEVAKRRALARFRTAQEFMRAGNKRSAAKYGLISLHGAKSWNEIFRFMGGLAMPNFLLRRRRSNAREAAVEKYGRLSDLRQNERTNMRDRGVTAGLESQDE